MTDTIEALKTPAADLTARVAAFERARVEKTFEWARVEEEAPPKLTASQIMNIVTQCSFWLSIDTSSDIRCMAARLLRELQETPGERLKRIADETDEADFENERTDYE